MKYSIDSGTFPKRLSLFGLYLFSLSIPVSFVPAEFAIAIIFIGWLLEGMLNRHWQYYPSRLYFVLLFYIGWNIIASSISPRPLHSLLALADNEWPMTIMLFMVFIVDERAILQRIVRLWLMTASVAALYGIWQSFSGVEIVHHAALGPMGSYFRAVGFNGFFLTFAGFQMTVFFIALSLAFQAHITGRWRYFFAACVSCLAVLGTFARSIWLSFVVAVPLFGLMKGKRIGGVVTAAFVCALLLCIVFVPSIRDRAYSAVVPSENQTRLNLWRTSVNMAKDFPVTGIGEDNFDYYFEKYKVQGFYDATSHPHNDYLTVLVSSGIPGLIAFIAIWVIVLRYGFDAMKKNFHPFLRELALGGTLAIIGFMVGGLFQNYYGTFANCWGWWFVTGLVLTSRRLSSDDERPGQSRTIGA
jgi:O-antigen ligase